MNNDDEARRKEIRTLLAGGLGTEVFPRADTHEQVQEFVRRLQERQDITSKLVVSGMALHPVQHNEVEQFCRSCMYYLIRRRHCALPELDMPVEPD